MDTLLESLNAFGARVGQFHPPLLYLATSLSVVRAADVTGSGAFAVVAAVRDGLAVSAWVNIRAQYRLADAAGVYTASVTYDRRQTAEEQSAGSWPNEGGELLYEGHDLQAAVEAANGRYGTLLQAGYGSAFKFDVAACRVEGQRQLALLALTY